MKSPIYCNRHPQEAYQKPEVDKYGFCLVCRRHYRFYLKPWEFLALSAVCLVAIGFMVFFIGFMVFFNDGSTSTVLLPTETSTPIPLTLTLIPTDTSIPPTWTPYPTLTLIPTDTPIPPTWTPYSTLTLIPTDTSIPPTWTPYPTDVPIPTAISVQNNDSTWIACSDARPSRLSVNMHARVTYDPPLKNWLRTEPSTSGTKIWVIAPGEGFDIIGGPACSNGWVWWRVRVDKGGKVGWTAEGDDNAYWLEEWP